MSWLKRFWAWWQIYWIAVLLLACLGIGLANYTYFFARDLGRPFLGFAINQGGKPDPSSPVWWPGMVDGRLTYQYKIQIVGGKTYNQKTLRTMLQSFYDAGLQEVNVTFKYQGQLISRQLPILKVTPAYFFDYLAAYAILGFGFWVLAWTVYQANPHNRVNRRFAIPFALVATTQVLISSSIFSDGHWGRNYFDFVQWDLAAPFIGVTLIHFASIFPYEIPYRRWWLIPMYAWTSFVVLNDTLDRFTPYIEPKWLNLPTDNQYSGNYPTILAIGCMAVYYSYLRWRDRHQPRVRAQMTIIIIGVMVAASPLAIIVLNAMGYPTAFFWMLFDLRVLLIAGPLAFAYAILRYQTLSGSRRILLFVLLMMTTAVMTNFFSGVIFMVEPTFAHPTHISLMMVLFGTGLAFSLFWSRQSLPNGLLGRLFYRQTLNYEATNRFGERLLGQTDLDRLPNQIALALTEELELEQAALWLLEDGQFILTGQSGQWTQPPPDHLTHTDTPSLEITPDLAMMLPLTASGQTLGVLGLGKRWDEAVFDNQDQQIVSLIAQQTALFLLTAQQINTLRQVPRQVAEAQERERNRLAQELHDETQQFLGRLPFFLETSRRIISRDPERTATMLERSISDVEEAARALRQIRNSLAPGQLEKGLVNPLQDLIQRFTLRTKLPVDSQLTVTIDELTSVEQRHALYRVVQQALDNAADHAQPSRITVNLTIEAARVVFSIQDDGRGFSEARRTHARAEGHFGLASMQNRITTLGGGCEIESIVGQGTTVRGWLPQK